MNKDEEHFIRVTVATVTRQLHELVMIVGGINACVKAEFAKDYRTLFDDFEQQLRDLQKSVAEVAETFPEERS